MRKLTLIPMFLIASLAILAMSQLTGCESLGLQPANTFSEKLAYAYGTHTAVLKATTEAVKAGALSGADATQVLSLADQSRQLLDAARAISTSGDANGATTKLVLATAILTQLQTYLQTHHGGP